MTLSLQEVSDRLEIQDVLVSYSHAVDSRDWDALDVLFTPDAVIDFTATGGPLGDLPSTKRFLADALPLFASTQHMLGASLIRVHGDVAEVRTTCHNPMVLAAEHRTVWFIGLWYVDALVRSDGRWRIRHRRQERSHVVRDLADAATTAS